MTTRLRSINPLQCAVVTALLYALFAVVIFAILAIFMTAIVGLLSAAMPYGGTWMHAPNYGGATAGLWLVVFAAISYGVLGFIGGLIVAVVYNVIAGWTGGIELTFSVAQPPTASAVVPAR